MVQAVRTPGFSFFMAEAKTPLSRAVIFTDGSNFYHGMKKVGVSPMGLDYGLFSRKLVGMREWVETRYYVGQVKQEGDLTRYQNQRRFLHRLDGFDRVNYYLGRVESRPVTESAKKLNRWLNALPWRSDVDISAQTVGELREIADNAGVTWVEKAVDVMIATDMVAMAHENKYDVAYLISADGDFTPAVKKVRETGRKVFVASPMHGAQLAKVADTFIPLRRGFFDDCMNNN